MTDSSYLNEIKELKNHDVRIIASINGTGQGSVNLYNICNDETLLNSFVNNVCKLVEDSGLDGLDIDWEYESSTYPIQKTNYLNLCNKLRTKLNNMQDSNGTPYYLTAAIPAIDWGNYSLPSDSLETRFGISELSTYLDYINIMSYDMEKGDKASHGFAFNPSSADNGYRTANIVNAVNNYANYGFPKSKLIVGFGGYGKVYKVAADLEGTYPALGQSGTKCKLPGYTYSFNTGTIFTPSIMAAINSGDFVKYTEINSSGDVVASYLYDKTNGYFITYEDEAIMKQKIEYIETVSGMGLMLWSYCEDGAGIYMDVVLDKLG